MFNKLKSKVGVLINRRRKRREKVVKGICTSRVLPFEESITQPPHENPNNHSHQESPQQETRSTSNQPLVTTRKPASGAVSPGGWTNVGREIVVHDNVKDNTILSRQIEANQAFKVLQAVGQGGFGVVMKVHTFHDEKGKPTTLAMKVIPKKRSGGRHRTPATKKLLNEITIMNALGSSSPFIQCIHGAYESSNNVFIISEFIGGADAFYYFSESTKFSEKQIKIILAELFLGLEYIHSRGYLHCDIKAENVIFDRQGHVKIVDFGLARELDEELPAGEQMPMSPAGSLPYMPPELLADCAGGRHTDWWAYGVLAFEFFTGCSPWQNMNSMFSVLSMEICSRDVCLPHRPFSNQAKELVESLLTRDYRYRLGTCQDADIKKLSFFKKINWEKTAELKEPPAFFPPFKCTIVSDEYGDNMMRTFQELIALDMSEQPLASELTVLSDHRDFTSDHQVTAAKREGIQEGLVLGLKSMSIHYDRDIKCTYCVPTLAPSSPVTPPMSFSGLLQPSNREDRPKHLFEGTFLGIGGERNSSTSRSESTAKTGSMTLDSFCNSYDTHSSLTLSSLMVDQKEGS